VKTPRHGRVNAASCLNFHSIAVRDAPIAEVHGRGLLEATHAHERFLHRLQLSFPSADFESAFRRGLPRLRGAAQIPALARHPATHEHLFRSPARDRRQTGRTPSAPAQAALVAGLSNGAKPPRRFIYFDKFLAVWLHRFFSKTVNCLSR